MHDRPSYSLQMSIFHGRPHFHFFLLCDCDFVKCVGLTPLSSQRRWRQCWKITAKSSSGRVLTPMMYLCVPPSVIAPQWRNVFLLNGTRQNIIRSSWADRAYPEVRNFFSVVFPARSSTTQKTARCGSWNSGTLDSAGEIFLGRIQRAGTGVRKAPASRCRNKRMNT